MNINSLNAEESLELVREATQAYYGGGQPIMSDAQFNALIEHIREIAPDSHIPYSVGFGYKVDGVKRPHRVQTSGMPKIKEGNGVPTDPGEDARVTPKYDGLCVIAYYEPDASRQFSLLKEILTRGGDEGSGKPVTHNLLSYFHKRGWERMPVDIQAIAMEAVVSLSNFLSLPAGSYELPRSAASGLLQARSRHDSSNLLEARPYRIYRDSGEEIAIVDGETEKQFQELFGEDAVLATGFKTVPELKAWSHHTGYPTDGVVLWDSVAIKFETETVVTTVIRVERNVSRLGRIVPVLVFTPVRLYGTTVSRCPFVSESWVKYHKVGPGAQITVTKFNEITPGFVDTVTTVPYEPPTVCPECGGPVDQRGGDLFCSNNCVGDMKRVSSFVFTFGSLLGYSGATLQRILDLNEIVTFDQFLSKAGQLTSDGLSAYETVWVDHLNQTFTGALDMNYLLCALNLPGIGWKWSEKLAPHVVSYLITGISLPFSVSSNVRGSLERNRDLILRAHERFRWTSPAEPTSTP